ncbi:MAG: sigma-70 family RNA polymerase sigma factor [Phycisphaerales bacterium]|nr:sigma-70 family RNA polymerase sigma factor [Phycisphaerales bacterium]
MSQTDWGLIHEAGAGEGPASERAMEKVARRYWPAIYTFIRHRGYNVDRASDLTQKFMTDVVMARQLCATADPERGRFRALLMTSLRNFVHQEARRSSSPTHGGRTLSIDDIGLSAALVDDDTPESAFSATWAVMLVRRVLARLRETCLADGLESHWTVFDRRVVRPLLLGEEPESYLSLVERLELDGAGQASNMLITVKRRFARALLDEIALTVDDPTMIEDELCLLLRDLERP